MRKVSEHSRTVAARGVATHLIFFYLLDPGQILAGGPGVLQRYRVTHGERRPAGAAAVRVTLSHALTLCLSLSLVCPFFSV